jgi:hypothetical protein
MGYAMTPQQEAAIDRAAMAACELPINQHNNFLAELVFDRYVGYLAREHPDMGVEELTEHARGYLRIIKRRIKEIEAGGGGHRKAA